MIASLFTGIALGFSAGINPGPLTSLVMTTSLERGFSAGLRVAAAPLITDAPIVLISVLLVRSMPAWLTVALGCVGGVYLIYLGGKTVMQTRTLRAPKAFAASATRAELKVDMWRGVMVNTISPAPWIFWITVGGPLLASAWQQSFLAAAVFLFGFYLLLVGGKVVIAAVMAGSRTRLNDVWYRRVFFFSGVLLILFGVLLFYDAIKDLLQAVPFAVPIPVPVPA